jgi:hypothetical protein
MAWFSCSEESEKMWLEGFHSSKHGVEDCPYPKDSAEEMYWNAGKRDSKDSRFTKS